MKLFGWIGLCMAFFASAQAVADPPSAAGLRGAKAYVDWVYRSLPDDKFDGDHLRYAPELRRWFDRDRAYSARTGYVGALDFEPLCDCQDFDADYRFESRVVRTATGAAARIRLHNGGWSVVRIDLIHSRRGWLIADVHSKTIPSLLAWLRREVLLKEKEE